MNFIFVDSWYYVSERSPEKLFLKAKIRTRYFEIVFNIMLKTLLNCWAFNKLNLAFILDVLDDIIYKTLEVRVLFHRLGNACNRINDGGVVSSAELGSY